MTGDWHGRRTLLEERGIVFQSSLTQFYQGVTSGGAEQTFRYGAKLDLFTELNTEKMGLWKGGSFFVHAVSWNSEVDRATEWGSLVSTTGWAIFQIY